MLQPKTPYQLGEIAGKEEYHTRTPAVMPDFSTQQERDDWESGRDRGFLLETALYKEAQHA